jgi:hypothetical protein
MREGRSRFYRKRDLATVRDARQGARDPERLLLHWSKPWRRAKKPNGRLPAPAFSVVGVRPLTRNGWPIQEEQT